MDAEGGLFKRSGLPSILYTISQRKVQGKEKADAEERKEKKEEKVLRKARTLVSSAAKLDTSRLTVIPRLVMLMPHPRAKVRARRAQAKAKARNCRNVTTAAKRGTGKLNAGLRLPVRHLIKVAKARAKEKVRDPRHLQPESRVADTG